MESVTWFHGETDEGELLTWFHMVLGVSANDKNTGVTEDRMGGRGSPAGPGGRIENSAWPEEEEPPAKRGVLGRSRDTVGAEVSRSPWLQGLALAQRTKQ